MSQPKQHDPARRAFLRDAIRIAVVGGLAAAGAAMVARQDRCKVAPACQSCAALPRGCDRPEALAARQTTQDTNHGR